MLDLLNDPAVWASFLTLTLLEVVLGVDNVIFISIAASKLPEEQRRRARFLGLMGALVLRIGLLFSIAWIIGLSEPFVTLFGWAVSWRDVILIAGGFFPYLQGRYRDFRRGGGQRITHRRRTRRCRRLHRCDLSNHAA